MFTLTKRPILDISILALIFIGPAWIITLILTILGIAVFKKYYEAIFVGLIMDVLYKSSVPGIHGSVWLFTIGLSTALAIGSLIRPHLRLL